MGKSTLSIVVACAAAFAGVIVSTGPAGAVAAPANDTQSAATVVTGLPFHDTIADTTGATIDADDLAVVSPDPNCQAPANVGNSVWYKFTAGNEGAFAVTDTGSSYTVGLGIATGTPGHLTIISCGVGRATTQTVSGTTYFVGAVDFYGTGGGSLDLTFTTAPVISATASRGTADRAGNASITLTYSCKNATSVDSDGSLTQTAGRLKILGSGFAFDPAAVCDGSSRSLAVPMTAFNGKFAGGKAVFQGEIGACDDNFNCAFVQLTQTVQLSRSSK